MDEATYGIALSNYMQSAEFLRADDDLKQENIKSFRAGYLNEFKNADVALVDSITESANKSFLQ